MDRFGAVAVHDGGDLVVAADLAGRALAELECAPRQRACWCWTRELLTRGGGRGRGRALRGRVRGECLAVGLDAGRRTDTAPPADHIGSAGATASITDIVATGLLWPVLRPSPRQPCESRGDPVAAARNRRPGVAAYPNFCATRRFARQPEIAVRNPNFCATQKLGFRHRQHVTYVTERGRPRARGRRGRRRRQSPGARRRCASRPSARRRRRRG